MIYLHPWRLSSYFEPPLALFPVFSKLVFKSSGLQLMGHPIQSGRTESAFRKASCCPSYWETKSYRLFEFKTGTDSTDSTEKSIPTLWSPTYCERKAENSLGLRAFLVPNYLSEMQILFSFILGLAVTIRRDN